jgi:hypothetical protein
MQHRKGLRRVGRYLSSRPRPRALAPGRAARGRPAAPWWRVVCCLVALAAAGLALGLAPVQSARAAALTVDNCNAGGPGSLAAAVAAANASAGADTITITASCTGNSTVNPGATLVLSDTSGATTITRAGAASDFGVGGGYARTVFVVNTGVTATISGIAIVAGRGATGTTGTTGTAGTPADCLNAPGSGGNGGNGGNGGAGGIANSGTLTLANTTVNANTGGNGATGGGGGGGGNGAIEFDIYRDGGNGANGGTGGNGGGAGEGSIPTRGTHTLANITVSGNTGGSGGSGSSGGTGGRGGNGGTGVNGGLGTAGGNGGTGGNGGSAGVGGAGAIAHNAGTLELANITINANTGGSGATGGTGGTGGVGGVGGIGNGNGGSNGAGGAGGTSGANGGGGSGGVRRDGGTVTIGGTILAGNTGGDYSGATVTDNGYNLVGTANGGATFTGTGTQAGVTNPQLGPLQNNSFPTQTRLPAPTSPAINAGAATCDVTYTNPVTMTPVTLTTDQRGVPRPQGGRCDSGAVEARFIAIVVDNASDGAANEARCTDAQAGNCRLRDALAVRFGVEGGVTITFDATAFPPAGPPRTITLDPAQGQLTLALGATITGPGANVLTVARDTAADTPQFRIFQVDSGVNATISGLTITGGDVHFGANDGAGILSAGTLTLADAAVTNNFAGQNGGGIHNYGGTLAVRNTTVSGNSAYNTGGGIGQTSGTTTLTNVTVSDNGASRGSGISIGQGGTSTLTNVTVSGNTAVASGGGGLYNGGTLNATRTIVAGNTGGEFGLLGINGTTNAANLTAGDPMLAPLGDYGGPTRTRPPLPGSPAIDAGGGCTGTDQRGVSRPQGKACDIGSVEVVPDATAPTTTATLGGTTGNNGWYTSAVTVTLAASDPDDTAATIATTYTVDGGAPAAYTAPFAVAGDGTHTVAFSSKDRAGNAEATQTRTIAIDAGAPTGVAGTPARQPDSNGWYTKPVAVTFSGTDATAGIASCTSATYGGPDSAAATVSGSCTDKAGNVASATFTLKYDASAPTGVIGTPARQPDSNGWYNTPVTVTFSATDATAGVAGCTSATYGGPDSAAAAVGGSCTDQAGNTSAPASFPLKYDTTAPATTATPDRAANANGWYNGPVAVTLNASDALSGVARSQYNLDDAGWTDYAPGTAIAVSGDRIHTLRYRSVDTAGNQEADQTLTIRIDTAAPTVAYTGNAATYTADQPVAITCAASDALSGVASSTCANISGPAYTFALGPNANSFAATATDKAGNTGGATTTFTVTVDAASLDKVIATLVTDPKVVATLQKQVSAIAAAPNAKAKASSLNAFIRDVQAHTGKGITPANADILIALAKAL